MSRHWIFKRQRSTFLSVVLLVVMYKEVTTFESVDEILKLKS